MLDHLVVQSLQEQETRAILTVRNTNSIKHQKYLVGFAKLASWWCASYWWIIQWVWTKRENNDSTIAGRDGFWVLEAVVEWKDTNPIPGNSNQSLPKPSKSKISRTILHLIVREKRVCEIPGQLIVRELSVLSGVSNPPLSRLQFVFVVFSAGEEEVLIDYGDLARPAAWGCLLSFGFVWQ